MKLIITVEDGKVKVEKEAGYETTEILTLVVPPEFVDWAASTVRDLVEKELRKALSPETTE